MSTATSLLESWIKENNDLVTKWKKLTEEMLRKDQRLPNLRCLSLEFHKLLNKIQGAPLLKGVTQLELTVMYNACAFSVALSEFSKVELLITNVIEKVLQISGCCPIPGSPDYNIFWRKVLEKSAKLTDLELCLGQLFCLQWATWLATQKCNLIQEIEKEILFIIEKKNKGQLLDSLLLVLEPQKLIELLHVCSLIGQGKVMLTSNETSSDGISLFPESIGDRSQLCQCTVSEHAHLQQLGNIQAEIQTLELLYSVLNLTHASDCSTGHDQLISSALLLSSPSLKNMLEVPSALTVLHSLALRSVHHERLSEGVEHYLDLLTVLHTDQPNLHHTIPILPRLADLYLEAAAVMLMVQRTSDCVALCDEVVGTTADLLPESLVLEESSMETEPSDADVDHDDKEAMVLWAGAANLLKGHCCIHLKDWKEAMTHYTSTHMVSKEGSKLFTLQKLKVFSFTGRGICFAQTDRLKEALKDLHLSLHAFPECVGAGLWCGEVLWRLGRRQEAAICWKKTWSFTSEPSKEDICIYLMEPPSNHMLDLSELQQRIEDLETDRNG
ncbi:hypothetical protein WMY93_004957 [Mugilogobius chulae]|uniref:Fanconi anemia group G protein n=1 Tax=Mugilogobius chulae TaxID=88201 RepID=A0AAW0Q0P3_9GOBI